MCEGGREDEVGGGEERAEKVDNMILRKVEAWR